MDEQQGKHRYEPEAEVEGHAVKRPAKPATDPEPEVEGHRLTARWGATPEPDPAVDPEDGEVEGHIRRYATEGPQPGGEAEVEGHRARYFASDQPRPTDDPGAEVEGHFRRMEPAAADEPEVEGSALRGKAVPDRAEIDPEPEVEGHAFKPGKRQIDAAPTGDEPEVEGRYRN